MSKEKAKQVKRLLGDCKNDIERKRVTIMTVYLGGKDTDNTANTLGVSVGTVTKVINLYVTNPEGFYKTNFKGKIETEERKKLKEEIKEYVEKKIISEENLDINCVLRDMNKMYDKEVTTYNGMRWILRKYFQYNYQKPFVKNQKKPEYAEEIIKGRLTKAVLEIAIEERNIDGEDIKNKKTKISRNRG